MVVANGGGYIYTDLNQFVFHKTLFLYVHIPTLKLHQYAAV